jgi:hypothetical protein
MIDGIGPIDEQPAPDHEEENGEVDPMEPTDCKEVF